MAINFDLKRFADDNRYNGTHPRRRRIRVIVVDDNLVITRFMSNVLKETGYDVVAVCSGGSEAVSKAMTLKPDVMTMDILMPDLEGHEAVEKILAKQPDINIIMVTSVVEKDRVVECIKKGAKGYVIKPLTKESQIAEMLMQIKKCVINVENK